MIDVTGSMGWCINSVKSNLQAFTEALVNDYGIDVRFAIIQYSDPFRTVTYNLEGNSPWTSDVSLVEAGLEKAANSINGGTEVPNEAVYHMLQLQFRPKSSKFAFLLTDEGSDVENDQTALQQPLSKLAETLAKNKIVTTVVGENSDYYRRQLQVLSDRTGGQYLDIGSQDYYLMMLEIATWIGEVTGLNVDVLGRNIYEDCLNVITDAREEKFRDSAGRMLTERLVANADRAKFTKSGYTADGNTKLILRVQHNQPGKVKFEVDKKFGTLEALFWREAIDSKTQIETKQINGQIHQASAVLTAPEIFPSELLNNDFPKRDFTLKVTFTPSNGGKSETKEINLSILQPPVVFIHGIYSNGETFAEGDTDGVYSVLNRNGIPIGTWSYESENYEGPTYHIKNKALRGESSGLYDEILKTIATKIPSDIACTRVDLVCHSMGGLMARVFDAYESRKYDTAYYQGVVRYIVTIATPHEGSPMTVYLSGRVDDLPYFQDNSLLRSMERSKEAYQTVIDILHNSDTLEAIRDAVPPRSEGISYSGTPGAWTDLALESDLVKELRDNIKYPRVPIAVIYGDISTLINNWLGTGSVINTVRDMVQEHPEYRSLVERHPVLLDDKEVFRAAFKVLFNHEDYDIAVGESSAKSFFPSTKKYTTGVKNGLLDKLYHHFAIYHQSDVAQEILTKLKTGKDFNTQGLALEPYIASAGSRTTAKVPAKFSQSVNTFRTAATDDHFITKYSLAIDSGSTITPSPTQDVTFTVTADEPIEHNVYLSIKGDTWGTFLQLDSLDNELKTFGATLTFTSADAGTFNFHALSQANASDADKSYISDTHTLKVLPELEYGDAIENLNFMSSILTLRSGDQVSLSLFGTTKNGHSIKLSDPQVLSKFGISMNFSDSSVAEINSDGKITALNQGTTTLTASLYNYYSNYSQLEASIEIEVDITHYISEPPEPTSKDLLIITSSLADGTAGFYYSEILESTLSITEPVAWTVSGLPLGLSCDVDGIINGKPATSGKFALKITVSNDGETDEKELELVINRALNENAPIISTQALPNGFIGEEYRAEISAVISGDASDLRWNLSGGNLPDGLMLQNYSGEHIEISGTPTTNGSSTFMIMAANNNGSDTQSFTIVINEAPVFELESIHAAISGNDSLNLTLGQSAELVFTANVSGDYSDGNTLELSEGCEISWAVDPENLPIGFSFSDGILEVDETAKAGKNIITITVTANYEDFTDSDSKEITVNVTRPARENAGVILDEFISSIISENSKSPVTSLIIPNTQDELTPEKLELLLENLRELRLLILSDSNVITLNLSETNAPVHIISLSGNHGIRFIDVSGLTSLQVLNVSDCTNLESIDAMDCVNLSDIDLSGCVNLKTLDLDNTALSEIDAGDCRELTRLQSNGYEDANATRNGKLENLNIENCTKLEILSISGNMLTHMNLPTAKFTSLQQFDATNQQRDDFIPPSSGTLGFVDLLNGAYLNSDIIPIKQVTANDIRGKITDVSYSTTTNPAYISVETDQDTLEILLPSNVNALKYHYATGFGDMDVTLVSGTLASGNHEQFFGHKSGGANCNAQSSSTLGILGLMLLALKHLCKQK